jgi:hypothetical protein
MKLRIADFLLYIAFLKRRPLGRATLTSSAGGRLALCLTTLQMADFYSATLAGNLSAVDISTHVQNAEAPSIGELVVQSS